MRNLRRIIKRSNISFLLIIILFLTNKIFSEENKILFKINDKAFTTYDYEMRMQYLDFIGNNSNLDKDIIINDFISANLFFEYKLNSKLNIIYQEKVNKIYDEVYKINNENKKIYNYEINKENIIYNIKIDYIRKLILEKILNDNINNLNNSNNEIDLLYNFKLKYINFKNDKNLEIKDEIKKLSDLNINKVIEVLKKNNVNYFIKEKEINNINLIDEKIKKNILANKNFLLIEKKDNFSLIFIEKKFETLKGLFANIYSVRTKNKLDKNYLACDNLKNNENNLSIENKEYKFINLNDELKRSLVNINDYVQFIQEDYNIYIVLCEIRFDKEILNNFNLNKMINSNVNNFEKKFVEKYSKNYNLIKINE